MATLRLENITKRYGKDVFAVKEMSLDVHDGEFLVLLGPSGCGKTTAMRMVAGLEDVTSGQILIDDDDVTDLPPRSRNVSMIFQNYAVWPHMTVYKNIAFALKLKKVAKDEIDRIVKETAEMTSIGGLLDRYPNQMSGGQQQRVAIARAIAVNPKIFLMDEPLSNLDAKLRVAMRTELKAIHVSTEATTVFVTHDQSEAMSMADRIVVMRDGSIEQIGTPEDVYARSANIFVADFIGTPPTNFMDAEVAVEGGDYVLRNPHLALKLNDKNRAIIQKYGKREVVIGIRPENILLTDSESAILHEACLVTEPQGSHQIIAIKVGDQIMKIVAPIRSKVVPGETVHVTFDQDTIHFFDKETSQSLWE